MKKKIYKNRVRTVRKKHVEWIGVSFHTALRKCCDSPATTIAWNLINLLTPDDMNAETNNCWTRWLEHLRNRLIGFKTDNHLTLARYVRRISLNDSVQTETGRDNLSDNIWWHKNDSPHDVYVNNSLHTVLRTFKDDEWLGLTSFLWEEIKPERRKKK